MRLTHYKIEVTAADLLQHKLAAGTLTSLMRQRVERFSRELERLNWGIASLFNPWPSPPAATPVPALPPTGDQQMTVSFTSDEFMRQVLHRLGCPAMRLVFTMHRIGVREESLIVDMTDSRLDLVLQIQIPMWEIATRSQDSAAHIVAERIKTTALVALRKKRNRDGNTEQDWQREVLGQFTPMPAVVPAVVPVDPGPQARRARKSVVPATAFADLPREHEVVVQGKVQSLGFCALAQIGKVFEMALEAAPDDAVLAAFDKAYREPEDEIAPPAGRRYSRHYPLANGYQVSRKLVMQARARVWARLRETARQAERARWPVQCQVEP